MGWPLEREGGRPPYDCGGGPGWPFGPGRIEAMMVDSSRICDDVPSGDQPSSIHRVGDETEFLAGRN
jgi:hypothetical protein